MSIIAVNENFYHQIQRDHKYNKLFFRIKQHLFH
jgi:hypothetical protein